MSALHGGWIMVKRDVLRNAQRENIRQAALSLADCGSYANWQAIEGILCIRYGVIEARRLFVDRAFCLNVNRRCTDARRKHDAPAA
ncbi:hypothetical protein SAMN05444172_9028 [Burkholderia sp. GAS332]|nr:hypothetical protein SAMN05444172_9028 [Burkholderia sp. GAS332]